MCYIIALTNTDVCYVIADASMDHNKVKLLKERIRSNAR